MKFGTYIGLVARRVWAKKGILLGSLLGATLVIALLVVVPLYESSVQAVDLQRPERRRGRRRYGRFLDDERLLANTRHFQPGDRHRSA